MNIQESYNPVKLAASGSISTTGCAIAGFICSTSGTLQLRNTNASGYIVLASMPVTAGAYHPMPLNFGSGVYAELGGGATGTFCVI